MELNENDQFSIENHTVLCLQKIIICRLSALEVGKFTIIDDNDHVFPPTPNGIQP